MIREKGIFVEKNRQRLMNRYSKIHLISSMWTVTTLYTFSTASDHHHHASHHLPSLCIFKWSGPTGQYTPKARIKTCEISGSAMMLGAAFL